MINNVGSASQALQGLQASRSFQNAGRSGSVFRQALLQEIQDIEQQQPETSFQEPAPASPTDYSQQWAPEAAPPPSRVRPQQATANPMLQQLQPMIQDVLQVAQDSGYIGVSSQDVLRAYQTGQSLLADYKV